MNAYSSAPTAGALRVDRDRQWRPACIGLSIFIALFGLPLLFGGVWLIVLGGSWYYSFAGLGLVAVAALLWQQRLLARHLLLAIWLITLAWSFWEVGLDVWALVPRLTGITVLLILTALLSPALRRDRRNA